MTMIGVDWGTTNLRAWRFDDDGAIAEMRRGATGIGAIRDRDFAGILAATISDWLGGDCRVILGGMIGSRNGWREVPYLDCPASLDMLAVGSLRVDLAGAAARIAPGLHYRAPEGIHHVMRGEEVQLVGAKIAFGTVVLPGTHSKWATIEGGGISEFRTFMTGELFALLCRHSFLAQSIEGDAPDAAAFAKGVDRALADPAISSLLFTVRTEGLFDEIAPTALADYLSGLLIGAEVARGIESASGPIAIIAEMDLADRYAVAFARAGVADTIRIDGNDAAAAGLWAIGNTLEWSSV